MKITSVTARSLRIPIAPPPYPTEGAGTKIEWGRRGRLTPMRTEPCLDYVIVRIETDEGVSRIGECQPDIGFFGETVEQVAAAVSDYLGGHLLGRDPMDREHLMSVVDFRGNGCAKSGPDMALHDLAGKVMGVPVSTLLGGRARTRVPVAVEIAGGPPDDMAAECVRFIVLGVRAFKPKIGGDPDADADGMQESEAPAAKRGWPVEMTRERGQAVAMPRSIAARRCRPCVA